MAGQVAWKSPCFPLSELLGKAEYFGLHLADECVRVALSTPDSGLNGESCQKGFFSGGSGSKPKNLAIKNTPRDVAGVV